MIARARFVVLLGVLAAANASCGGSNSSAQTAPAPQPLPNQIDIMISNLPVFVQVQLQFDQSIVMNPDIANGVQVANATEATVSALITSSSVGVSATGAGTADVLVFAVVQAENTISGSASIGGGTVTIDIGDQSYPISDGKFSIPVQNGQ